MLTLPNVTQAEIDAVASISKDEREQLVAKINATDPHLIFTPAQSKSANENVHAIICPRCANGSGENHTPVEVELVGGKWLYHCFKCDNVNGDLLNIVGDNSGLNLKSFNGLCEAIAIGLKLVGDNLPDEIPAPNPKSAAEIEFEEREKAEIKGDIEYAQNHLGDLPIRQERGLSFETLRHFGCGYFANWTHPKTRLSEKDAPSSRRLIIPTGDTHYNAVALPADRPNMKKNFHKMHAGKMSLFGLETVGNADIVVVVEGEIDAMSIYQASKVAVIAVLGAANWQATLKPVLTQKFTGKRFIILFDDDEAGKNNATNFKSALAKRFFPATVKSLADYLSDTDKQEFGDGIVIDANVILQKRGDKFLANVINQIISAAKEDFLKINSEADFNTQSTSAQVNSDKTKGAKDMTDYLYVEADKDLGNARRLEKFCGRYVRWLKDSELWLVWEPCDNNGGFWRRGSDKNSCISPFATRFADRFRVFCKKLQADADAATEHRQKVETVRNDSTGKVTRVDEEARAAEEKAKETAKDGWAIYYDFCKTNKVAAAVTSLKSIDSIIIQSTDLDKYPSLLNVKNGTVDLETGKFYPADPSRYLTQMCSVDYDPRADSTFIEEFFAQIQPDDDTRAALMRWLGYCLSGSVREEKFLIWRGEGGNGKGVLSRTIAALMRDYAAAIPRNALVVHKFDNPANSHTAALSPLINTRFCISEELSQSSMLDASLVKTLVGGDLQSFRKLFKEFCEVVPTAKINLSSNFVPRFQNVDDRGMGRRLVLMPFTQTFQGDKADPRLKEKMMTPENLRGLLKLLVDEAKAWYKDGLIISAAMTDATNQSLAENDFVKDFLNEYTEKADGEKIKRQRVIGQLRNKCPDAARFSDRQLTDMICKRGVKYTRDGKGYFFKGIRLVKDEITFDDFS